MAAIHSFVRGDLKNGFANAASSIAARAAVFSNLKGGKSKLSAYLNAIEILASNASIAISHSKEIKDLIGNQIRKSAYKEAIKSINFCNDDSSYSYRDDELTGEQKNQLCKAINSYINKYEDNLKLEGLANELRKEGFDVEVAYDHVGDAKEDKDIENLRNKINDYLNRSKADTETNGKIPDDGTIPEDQIIRHDYIPVINKETGEIEMVDVGKTRMQAFAKKMEDYLNDPNITRIFRNLLPSQINVGSWLNIAPAAWYKLFRSAFYYQYDPLALDLNGNGIETLAANGHDGALFDHERLGIRTATGWIHSNDGILVYDRNGDGKINDGGEIFGDNTLLKNGKTAAHGFEAAADLDDNGDGKLDAADSAFGKLGVWRDLNHNGISEEGEIFALKDLRIKSLNLGYTQADKDLGNGNTLAEVGSYTDEDGNEHIMGDLRLSADRLHSRYSNSIPLTDERVPLLPGRLVKSPLQRHSQIRPDPPQCRRLRCFHRKLRCWLREEDWLR